MYQDKYERIGELANQILSIPIKNIIDLRMHEKEKDKYICPFHDDHTPNNFKIRPKSNSFLCFACNTRGNGIQFVQFYDNISWKEAVVKIAKELSIITNIEEDELLSTSSRSYDADKITKPMTNLPIKKEDNIEASITKLTSIDIIDKVYQVFSQGYSLMGEPKLSEEHAGEINAKRNLDTPEMEEDGYFTFPNIDFLDTFLNELEKQNIPLECLKGVPGFYYSKPKQHWSFTVLKGTSGVGIPIKNIEGKIIGIQIRLDKISESKKRYQWFSSSFAGGDGSTGAKNIYGTSSGAPVAVVRPKQLKNATIFVTEGFFKARAIAKQWQCIALSVQGVNNWKEIPDIIDKLYEENNKHKNICIAFDGDMGRKETVLKPALQLGFALLNIEMNDTLKKHLEIILKTGNRSLSSSANNYKESANEITNLLEQNKNNTKYKIWFSLWNETFGKGIDDIIMNNCAETIRNMEQLSFWKHCFEMLCELDFKREEISKKENIEYKKVAIPDEYKINLYQKHIDSYLSK